MKERPIIFSSPMVRALLDGRKIQTRRVVNMKGIEFIGGRGDENDPEAWGYFFDGPQNHGYCVLARGKNERFNNGLVSINCPYGQPGDRLWVRETWCEDVAESPPLDVDGNPRRTECVRYRATDSDEDATWNGWRPSIHMPRWASRITLEITDVRVQRLNDITEEDARAEGASHGWEPDAHFSEVGAFAYLWNSIHGPGAWTANPWVWALTLKRIT